MTTRALLNAILDQLSDAIIEYKSEVPPSRYGTATFDDIPKKYLSLGAPRSDVHIEVEWKFAYTIATVTMAEGKDWHEVVEEVRIWPGLDRIVRVYNRIKMYIEEVPRCGEN